jgi:hypothetical protein
MGKPDDKQEIERLKAEITVKDGQIGRRDAEITRLNEIINKDDPHAKWVSENLKEPCKTCKENKGTTFNYDACEHRCKEKTPFKEKPIPRLYPPTSPPHDAKTEITDEINRIEQVFLANMYPDQPGRDYYEAWRNAYKHAFAIIGKHEQQPTTVPTNEPLQIIKNPHWCPYLDWYVELLEMIRASKLAFVAGEKVICDFLAAGSWVKDQECEIIVVHPDGDITVRIDKDNITRYEPEDFGTLVRKKPAESNPPPLLGNIIECDGCNCSCRSTKEILSRCGKFHEKTVTEGNPDR